MSHFVAGKHVRSITAFRTLPHPLNRVAVVEIVATGMVEKDTHYVPDFAASSGRSLQMFEPQLHLDSLDVREEVTAPPRHNPLVEIPLIGLNS